VSVVNVVKGRLWDAKSEFDERKDKNEFRKYEEACERVRKFYKEQHGRLVLALRTECFNSALYREADR
jgi:inositol oxygenase